MTVDQSVEAISAALRSGSDQFVVADPGRPPGRRSSWCTTASGCRSSTGRTRSTTAGRGPRTVTLEASAFDRRVMVAIDGQLLFDPYRLRRARGRARPSARSRSALGVDGGELTISELRIYPRPALHRLAGQHAPAGPSGCDRPSPLGPDEYFVLGDNSPVSNDSRFWAASPVVPGLDVAGQAVPGPPARRRSSRSRCSAGRFAGFPIPAESVTFDRESRSRRPTIGSARPPACGGTRPADDPTARYPGRTDEAKGNAHDGTVLRHSACRRDATPAPPSSPSHAPRKAIATPSRPSSWPSSWPWWSAGSRPRRS